MPRTILTNQPFPSGNVGVIQSLFDAAIGLLFQYSPNHPSKNCEVRVTYGTIGPHVRYGGNSVKGYDIDLTAGGDCWDDHLYQFSHEICHIFAQYQQKEHPNLWFEQSVCETSSLYCLKNIASMGAKGQGPCVNLSAGSVCYHQALDNYAENLINSPNRACNDTKHWFESCETDLRNNPNNHGLYIVGAIKLLPLFMTNPSNWVAVEFLNTISCANGHDSFREYLDNWQAATPSQHHILINQVRAMFF